MASNWLDGDWMTSLIVWMAIGWRLISWMASDRLEDRLADGVRLVDRCAAPMVEQPCAGRPEDKG
jgi:hypothetical protein